jgi:anti-sigma regulatory factor (Ser/Thr protein kinase)
MDSQAHPTQASQEAAEAVDPHPADGGMAGVTVPDRPNSIPAARAFLTRLLDGWGIQDRVIDDASLLASELMSNAVTHGAGVVDLKVEVEDGLLHVGVHDSSDAAPVIKEAGPDSSGGRGMWIVQSIAHDWGSDPSGDEPGKTVWFELALRS